MESLRSSDQYVHFNFGDVKFFSSFVAEPDQLRAVRNYRDALRQN